MLLLFALCLLLYTLGVSTLWPLVSSALLTGDDALWGVTLAREQRLSNYLSWAMSLPLLTTCAGLVPPLVLLYGRPSVAVISRRRGVVWLLCALGAALVCPPSGVLQLVATALLVLLYELVVLLCCVSLCE